MKKVAKLIAYIFVGFWTVVGIGITSLHVADAVLLLIEDVKNKKGE